MTIKVNYIIGIFVFLTAVSCKNEGFQIELNESFKEAKVFTKGNILNITTGRITRVWKLTDYGLLTKSVGNIETTESLYKSDWNLNPILPEQAQGKLIALTAKKSNDEGFTSNHLKISAEFEYKEAGISLKYEIWAYPNATGLRTQLFVKKLSNYQQNTIVKNEARAEYIPIKTNDIQTKLIGYYNDTQHRNTFETEILKEAATDEFGDYTWANVIDINSSNNSLMLIQESHKCANQPGVNSGGFHVNSNGLSASGLGIGLENITENYRPLWAYWTIAYEGNNDSYRQLVLKQFDRIRYPIDPERDIYIMANNWGSGSTGDESRHASIESNILREIQSQKDLGIDLQQVDDGWQGSYQYKTWDYVSKAKNKQFGEYDVYPEGWKNIKASAKKEDIRLGLWGAHNISGEALLKHYNEGGFTSYKLDFANLNTYDKFHGFVNKIREFIKKTNHKVRVNWDVTENPPRIGYYFGREYGNIYLENRKPTTPVNVVYHPYLVLRDAWQVAKYTNLNKFQISVQNLDKVNKKVSDAYLHNHPYSVAITLMGSPIFFQETHYYTKEAKDEIKPVIAIYKKHRNEMYQGFVFSIGEKPSNKSWSGFQNYNPDTKRGYLTIFREINNEESSKQMSLHFVKDTKLILTNLMTGTTEEKTINSDGDINFEIPKPADFRFYKYEIK